MTPMHLFLSPHPDDAPLSCGAHLYRLTQAEGQSAHILTVMAGDPQWMLPDTPSVRELHARWALGSAPSAARRAEDVDAGLVLGAGVSHTPIPDCIYRTFRGEPLYPTEAAIFAAPHPDDDARDLLLATGLPYADAVTTLYIPLAAGRHVDHQIVRDAGLALMRAHPALTVWFYEDYPYAARPGTVDAARATLESRVGPLSPVIRRCDPESVAAKIRSVSQYRSQISTFWPDLAIMEREIRTFMDEVGGGSPAERYWRVGSEGGS